MASVRTRHTDIEIRLAKALRARGYRFRSHAVDLPGRPDLVFTRARVAIFVDGDFWHGWRLPAWERKVSAFWREKLNRNRQRDASVHRKLRYRGWTVLRVWQHQIDRDLARCVGKVAHLMGAAPSSPRAPTR
jgi:DNA mismatch endonuclease (patch repair protein)